MRELWAYRELLYFLVWRDIKVRYKQALLGAGWAVLQPLATMAVFTFLFAALLGEERLPGGSGRAYATCRRRSGRRRRPCARCGRRS